MSQPKPTLFIIDGSVDVTGSLVSASRQALLLKDEVDAILVLSSFHRAPPERTTEFAGLITLPFVLPRKKIVNLLLYFPALILSGIQLRAAMRRHGCERLQLNDFYLLQGVILRLLGFRGRIVTFVRIDPTRYGTAGKIWLSAARLVSNELVAVSHFIQSLLGERYSTQLIYGQPSIDNSVVAQPDLAHPLFLFVGNYIQGKGQEVAIEAFNRIAARYPAARLRFVGGDMGLEKNRAFKAWLEQLAEEGPARERIEFAGPSNDVARHYATAFAAINLSESESFSITCLDASAVGLPVIASRCGGPEEIIEDGITGMLVPVGDPAEAAARMAWLLDHPVEATAMGAAGKALVVERFAPEQAKAALLAALALAEGDALR